MFGLFSPNKKTTTTTGSQSGTNSQNLWGWGNQHGQGSTSRTYGQDRTGGYGGQQLIDPRSQAYIDRMRGFGLQGAQNIMNAGPLFLGPMEGTPEDFAKPFLNPYMDRVIDPVNTMYDRAASRVEQDLDDRAIASGAFGGSRAAVQRGAARAGIEQARAGHIGQLHHQNWQDAINKGLGFAATQHQLAQQKAMEPLVRTSAAQNVINQGLGPFGQIQSGQHYDRGRGWDQQKYENFMNSEQGSQVSNQFSQKFNSATTEEEKKNIFGQLLAGLPGFVGMGLDIVSQFKDD